jgi:hypothetical protein
VKQSPNILCVTRVIESAKTTQAGLPDGRWVPARALGYASIGQRIKAAWLVFTGKADALTWPGQ